MIGELLLGLPSWPDRAAPRRRRRRCRGGWGSVGVHRSSKSISICAETDRKWAYFALIRSSLVTHRASSWFIPKCGRRARRFVRPLRNKRIRRIRAKYRHFAIMVSGPSLGGRPRSSRRSRRRPLPPAAAPQCRRNASGRLVPRKQAADLGSGERSAAKRGIDRIGDRIAEPVTKQVLHCALAVLPQRQRGEQMIGIDGAASGPAARTPWPGAAHRLQRGRRGHPPILRARAPDRHTWRPTARRRCRSRSSPSRPGRTRARFRCDRRARRRPRA